MIGAYQIVCQAQILIDLSESSSLGTLCNEQMVKIWGSVKQLIIKGEEYAGDHQTETISRHSYISSC